MRRWGSLLSPVVAMMLLGVVLGTSLAQGDDAPPSGQQFAFDLYAQLAQDDDANLFYSPTSIALALSMTANGADAATRSQMLQTLRIDDLDAANRAYATLLKAWNAETGEYQLAVANRLWGQEGFTLLPQFLSDTREFYNAPMELLDFAGAPEPSRQTINAWVERQTQDRIKDLLPSGSIDPLTRLVLTNAIYFKGDWITPFPPAATREADFTMTSGAKRRVPLMSVEEQFAYVETADLQAIVLPYRGDDLAMVVLLPKATDGLPALEKELSDAMVRRLVERARRQKARVFLPKFRLETSFNLNDALISLGMTDAFSESRADFTKMTGARDLYITDVIHKAFVEVDEKGTEAAAATGVVMGLRSAMPQPVPTFRADHPFVFAIRDNRSGELLFLGRFVKP